MPQDATPKSVREREIVLPKFTRNIDRVLLLGVSLWFAYVAGNALMNGRLAENARIMGLHPAFAYVFWLLLSLAGAELLWAAILRKTTWALGLVGMLAGGMRLADRLRPDKDWVLLMFFCLGLVVFPLVVRLFDVPKPAQASQE